MRRALTRSIGLWVHTSISSHLVRVFRKSRTNRSEPHLPVILYYDYLLTFSMEVERFWSLRTFTCASFFFFLNRYISVIGHIPVAIEFFWTTPNTLVRAPHRISPRWRTKIHLSFLFRCSFLFGPLRYPVSYHDFPAAIIYNHIINIFLSLYNWS
jgi:hypothetical protein